MNKVYTLDQIRNHVSEISIKYGIKSIYLFGSYAKELAGFHRELEEQLSVKVDVLTLDSLSPDFLKEIRKDEVLLYKR